MPDEIQEWQRLHDKAMRFASLAAKKIAELKAARKERVRRSHLKGLGWIAVAGAGGAKAWDLVSGHRSAVISGLASAAVAGTAGAAIACNTAEAGSPTVARRPPSIAGLPAAPAPRPSERAPLPRPSPTTPPPSPSPTRVPSALPTAPTENIVTTATEPRRTKPPHPVRPGRPSTRPPTVRPPVDPPGQTGNMDDDEGETLDECFIKIGDLEPFC